MLIDSNFIDPATCVIEQVSDHRLPLVNKFYSDCNYLVNCGRLDRVYSLQCHRKIIAAARLVPQVSGDFLLRNLCVAPDVRNQGIARYLVQEMLGLLRLDTTSSDVSLACYCFALPHLQNFYLSMGFKNLTIDEVPPDIAETHMRNCARKRGWILMGFVIS